MKEQEMKEHPETETCKQAEQIADTAADIVGLRPHFEPADNTAEKPSRFAASETS